MKIDKLDWDSAFFGYQIGKAEILNFHEEQYDELIEYLNKSQLKLIYIYPLDRVSKSTLQIKNIPLVSINVTFEKCIILPLKTIINTKSYYKDEHYEEIEKLGLLSGQYSRFKKDIKFSNNEFYRLYKEWIRRSISKEIATDVIVYRDANKISGFISYKKTCDDIIIIGLIAVSTSEHGKGIGKILMQSVENIAAQDGIKKILVTTQIENEKAMALYHSCGYKIKEQQEIFHLWVY